MQIDSSVSGFEDGGFVVTWTSIVSPNAGIYGRRYDADGDPVGGQFKINSTPGNSYELIPSVATLGNGGFVVAWQANALDGDYYGAFARLYDANGVALGNQFQVNTHTETYQGIVYVAALADGGFVVTWSSQEQDGSGYGIYGQRYDADGNPAGGEFPINTRTTNHQIYPSVAALEDGGFVVTWSSRHQLRHLRPAL